MRASRVQTIALTLALGLLAMIWLAPIVWVMVTSLKLTADIVRLPPEWIPWPVTLEHYQEVLLSSCDLVLTLENKAKVIVRFSVLRVDLQHLTVLCRSLVALAQELASTGQVVARPH